MSSTEVLQGKSNKQNHLDYYRLRFTLKSKYVIKLCESFILKNVSFKHLAKGKSLGSEKKKWEELTEIGICFPKAKTSLPIHSSASRNFQSTQKRRFLTKYFPNTFQLYALPGTGKRQLHFCQAHLEKETMQIPFFLLSPSWPSGVQLLSPCCHAGAWQSLGSTSAGPGRHAWVSAALAASSRCQCASAQPWLDFLQPPNKTPFLPEIQSIPTAQPYLQTRQDKLRCSPVFLSDVPARVTH